MTLLLILSGLVIAVISGTFLFLRSASFGALPAGEHLERIRSSAHYRDNRFQNLHLTPNLAEGESMLRVMYRFFFAKDKRNRPAQPLPSEKTSLLSLDPADNLLVWFGHSSYFIQADGRTILVDPVFSGHASPLNFTTGSYAGSDVYTAEEMPSIDMLVITHDHWDHLDYQTVRLLQPKVKQVVTGLGTGAHLRKWGYDEAIIHELDWTQACEPFPGFTLTAVPARHFSGRGFVRDRSLWTSFACKTPTMHIYLGGDSGFDAHFAEIGKQYGPFDLAILECGQYNSAWRYIHMLPEEVVQAAMDLNAAKILPVHWAKFSLGLHAWDEPIERITAEAARLHMPLLHPMIGEKVPLKEQKNYQKWWRC